MADYQSLDEKLSKGKYKEVMRNGIKYYASGPNAGKVVGSLRGTKNPKQQAAVQKKSPQPDKPKAQFKASTKTAERKKDESEKETTVSKKTSTVNLASIVLPAKGQNREVRIRGLATGKSSTVPYSPKVKTNTNMIGQVAFGKASKEKQKEVNKMLEESDIIVESLGIKFKQPIDFTCQNLTGQRTFATFIGLKEKYDANDRIDLKSDVSAGKSLIHEIGHAIDYSITPVDMKRESFFANARLESKAKVSFVASKQSQQDYERLDQLLKEAPFYKERSDKAYLATPTELFARAFEVYAYDKALELNKEGKISDDFVKSFHPDFLRDKSNTSGKSPDEIILEVAKKEPKLYSEYREASDDYESLVEESRYTFQDYEDAAAEGDKEAMATAIKEHRKLSAQVKRQHSKMRTLRKKLLMTSQEGTGTRADVDEIRKEISEIMGRVLSENPIKKAMQSLTLKLRKSDAPFYSVVVPINPKGEVLIGRRQEDGIWTTPTGGANPGEDPEECAAREAWEEAQLRVEPGKLQLIKIKSAPNGKPVYCYLYETGQMHTSVASDPDREVKEWKWVASEKLPKGLTKKNNLNRLETINEAFMKFYGLCKGAEEMIWETAKSRLETKGKEGLLQYIESLRKDDPQIASEIYERYFPKAGQQETDLAWGETPKEEKMDKSNLQILIDKLRKGGPGSGQRGHTTAKDSQPMENKLGQHLKDLKTKKVLEGLETPSGKPMMFSADDAKAQGYDHEDHRFAANTHWDMAQKFSTGIEKLEAAGKKVPKEAKDIVQFHVDSFKQHHKAADQAEKRAGEVESKTNPDAVRKDPKKQQKIVKSSTSMGHHEYRDLNIGDYVHAKEGSEDSPYLQRMYEMMDGFEYGDAPRVLNCPRGNLSMVKVDDGLYTGSFVKVSPDGTEDTAKIRLERLTIPDMIQVLEAKEYLDPMPAPAPPVENEQYQALDAKLNEIGDGMTSLIEREPPREDRKIRILELLAKLVN